MSAVIGGMHWRLSPADYRRGGWEDTPRGRSEREELHTSAQKRTTQKPQCQSGTVLNCGIALPGGSRFASNVLQLGIIAAEVGLQAKGF